MKTSEAQAYLEAAGHRLDETLGRLADAPSYLGSLHENLAEVLSTLRSIRDCRPRLAPSEQVAPLLQSIDSRIRRIQTLLDAAHGFYCGALSGALQGARERQEDESSPYAPNGQPPAYLRAGHLRVEA